MKLCESTALAVSLWVGGWAWLCQCVCGVVSVQRSVPVGICAVWCVHTFVCVFSSVYVIVHLLSYPHVQRGKMCGYTSVFVYMHICLSVSTVWIL